MYFDPHPNTIYPDFTDEHYLEIKKNNGIVFDESYPYVDESKAFKRKQFFLRIPLTLIVFPLCKFRYGLRINNRKILKKNKHILDKGVISVSNHVHMWDYIFVMKAVRYRHPYTLVWAPNVSGENGTSVRLVGGIPIPNTSLKAMNVFNKSVENLLNSGHWLHIYPEGSMWEYYGKIRPFKNGAAHYACKLNKPVVPIAVSYRKATWWRRLLFKQKALFTISIGELMFANPKLTGKEQEMELTTRLHQQVVSLAGLTQESNLYPPIFKKNPRIDY